MLKSLSTKNFRKLTDHTFEFGPGLQVVRGANEAGKSTMLEAWGYLFGGIKACRSDLAEMVTWGQPEKALSVKGVVEIDGVEYHGKRSKAGAEIAYTSQPTYTSPLGQYRVVGQVECTAFWERLLGADAATLGRLMLAKQGSIRGALDQGSKATMDLIESLANFDIIDNVIELIQANLVTGPDVTAKDRVVRAEAAVEEAKSVVTELDEEGFANRFIECDMKLALNQHEVSQWAPQHDSAKAAWQTAEKQHRDRESLQADVERQRAMLAKQQEEHLYALERSGQAPKQAQIDLAELKLQGALNSQQVKVAYDKVQQLVKSYPQVYWEGDAASLQSAIEAATGELSTLRSDVVNQQAIQTQATKELKQASGDTCTACGRPLVNAEEIRQHRQQAQERYDAAGKRLYALNPLTHAKADEIRDLQAVRKLGQDYDAVARACREHVQLDTEVVPTRLVWTAPLPAVAEDAHRLHQEVVKLLQLKEAAQVAAATAEALAAMITRGQQTLAEAAAHIATLTLADELPRLAQEFETVAAQYNQRVNDIAELRQQKARIEAEQRNAKAIYAQQMKGVAVAEAGLNQALQELQQLNFNNNLLKRVRAARPVIADRLWTIVLASVSAYFSAMRGTRSLVTRAQNAFKVDGQSIEGLSGSTLDILGLAIRLALTRTFIPTATFLILDEPAAACDDSREDAMLGFLLSCGFPQTLLVTHSDVEAVASNLIELKEAA